MLFQGTVNEAPDDLEEVFEEPIEDERDVVVEINWEYERHGYGSDDETDDGDGADGDDGADSNDETDDTDGDDEMEFEVTQAAVVLTDSPGIDAHAVRAESAIAGGSMETYEPDEEPGG